jgi:Fe-S cluster biogenesis protein NfuA
MSDNNENFENTNNRDDTSANESELIGRVRTALEKIRPYLMADGGDVELVAVEDKVVKVKMQGACGGCPYSIMTLTLGIERVIKQDVPEIEKVEAV